MRALSTIAIACGLVLALGARDAAAESIDFDSLPAGTALVGTPAAGTVISTGLNGLGIVFGRAGVSAGVAVIDTVFTMSQPNGIAGLDAAGNIPKYATGDIYFHFVVPGTLLDGVTDSLSFLAGDTGTYLDTLRVRAYDLWDTVIFDQTQTQSDPMSFNLNVAGIHRVHIQFLTGTTAGFLADNLKFNTPTAGSNNAPLALFSTFVTVPEPASVALFGFAVVAVFLLRRGVRT